MIRPMKKSDLPQCGAIYAKAFPPEHWGIDWNARNAAEYLTDLFEQKRFVGFVQEESEGITGCIFAVRKICSSREELHISEMAVLPEKQGQGIGRKLLDRVKACCREQHLAGLVLYTNAHAPATAFYQKNDFQVSPGTICMYLDMSESED